MKKYATVLRPRPSRMLRLREAKVITLTLVCVVASADLKFPKDFFLGVGSSAYQTEGGWNVDGKSRSNMDHLVQTKWSVSLKNATGNYACESYYKYKEDVRLIKNLGFNSYRFSVSWPRVLPDGVLGRINWEAIEYYRNLTQELIDNNIEPIVTIYHWDHPYVLEEMGGWLNEEMVDWFVDYARVVIEQLGPMVQIFTTINEITEYCQITNDDVLLQAEDPSEILPEYIVRDKLSSVHNMSKILTEFAVPNMLRCMHNMLKAHAKVYHIYDKEYRPIQGGQIGIAASCHHILPRNASDPSDIAFAEIASEFFCDIYMHAIWIGDYPESVKMRIAKTSKARGYSTSALLELSPAWVDYIRGTSDYFGLNYYTSYIILPDNRAHSGSRMIHALPTDSRIHAMGLRKTLLRIKNKYNNPPIIILENGHSGQRGLVDPERVNVHNLMLKEMLISIQNDRTNVTGYFVWSFLDSFEWLNGYTLCAGIIEVDFTSPDRTRTPKLSAKWWKKVLETRDLDAVDTIRFMAKIDTNADDSSIRSSLSAGSPETSFSSLLFTLALTCGVLFWKILF